MSSAITSRPGTCRALRLIALFGIMLLAAHAHAEHNGEILLFPSITTAHRSGIHAGDELQAQATEAAVDLLLTGSAGNFRYLGEFNYASYEKELSRVNISWRTDGGTVLSVGRFHNLQGYWNTQFHHGAYLATSISHPGLIEDDGPLPVHYLGLQLDGKLLQHGTSPLDYAFGIGKTARWHNGMLDSPSILHPGRDNSLNVSLRLAYSHEEGGPNQAGVFLASNKIPANSDGLTGIKQTVYGVFSNWENENFRLIGEAYAFENTLSGSCSACTGTFASVYLQGEYRAISLLTFYARVEDTFGSVDDPYLSLLPEFAKRRRMAGLRYDLPRKQTIKLELSHTARVETGFDQLQIQWSAVFP